MDKRLIPQVIYDGKHLSVLKTGNWEYVKRTKATGVIAVVAMHEDQRVVLVEQYRTPIDAKIIELPAGLVGDEDDHETMLHAAKRELEEETGYQADDWQMLNTTFVSPGLTDEAITFFVARGLTKVSAGGGVDDENIIIHEIPLAQVKDWFKEKQASDTKVDMKLLAGLFAAGV